VEHDDFTTNHHSIANSRFLNVAAYCLQVPNRPHFSFWEIGKRLPRCLPNRKKPIHPFKSTGKAWNRYNRWLHQEICIRD
jgi:hypothetical protein